MQGSNAIAAASEAIVSLLTTAVSKPEFTGASVKLYQSKDLQTPMQEGIALYLYRLSTGRNPGSLPTRFQGTAQRVPLAFPIDLHYLLVAYGSDASKQQRLLGCALRTIVDVPVLDAALTDPYGPEEDSPFENEAPRLMLETLSIQDLTAIWRGVMTPMEPCAAFVLRVAVR
jgi:hypothetical protein